MHKVLLINGSPKEKGCTYTALKEIADTLANEGVECEIFHVRSDAPGCRDCGYCAKKGRCSIKDDVNAVADRLDEFDAIVLGSPVYYAGPSGQVCAFADRLFYSNADRMAGKLGAAVVSCRRGGASAALTSTSPSATCRWYRPSTGTRSTASPRMTFAGTWRVCRRCAPWPATLPGS